MKESISPDSIGISVVVCASCYNFADKIFDNYIRQNVAKKELIIMVHNQHDDFEKWVNRSEQYMMTRVYQQDESKSVEECLNYCIEQAIFDYIVIFDEGHFYDSEYLSGAILQYAQNSNGNNRCFKNPYLT